MTKDFLLKFKNGSLKAVSDNQRYGKMCVSEVQDVCIDEMINEQDILTQEYSIKVDEFAPTLLTQLPQFNYLSRYHNQPAANPRMVRKIDEYIYITYHDGVLKTTEDLSIVTIKNIGGSYCKFYDLREINGVKEEVVTSNYTTFKYYKDDALVWNLTSIDGKSVSYIREAYFLDDYIIINFRYYYTNNRGALLIIDKTGNVVKKVIEWGSVGSATKIKLVGRRLYVLKYELDEISVYDIDSNYDLQFRYTIKKPENTVFNDLNIYNFDITEDESEIWVYSDSLKKLIQIDKNGNPIKTVGKFGFENYTNAKINPNVLSYMDSDNGIVVLEDRLIITDSNNQNVKIFYKDDFKEVKYNIPDTAEVLVSEKPLDTNNIYKAKIDEELSNIKVAYKDIVQ